MDVFPAAIPLAGLTVAVAGDGEAADAKARLFDGSPARLVRIAAAEAAQTARYAGARLAFIALDGPEPGPEAAAVAARDAGALVNVVDRPALCDFHTPALIDRGAVVGAVASGGAAPVLAAELRAGIEARWPARLGELATLIAGLTAEVRSAIPEPAARRAWLRRELVDGPAAALALAGERDAALAEARWRLADPAPSPGQAVWLEPPAAPDLLSLRALQALSRADLLVVANGADDGLLTLARVAPRDLPAAMLGARVANGERIVCIGPAAAFETYGALTRLAGAPDA
jgi:precorrin-2 dehydrogenase/sirohydrochlorin ferrochelatase